MPGMSFRSRFSVSEEKFLPGPVFFVSSDMFNMDCLSHVNSSDGLVSSDGSKAQPVTLGHSPHTSDINFNMPPQTHGTLAS